MHNMLPEFPLEGFLLINKPAGVSSFSLVMHLKRLLPKGERVGHAGTLDPFASGLLIIGIGRNATRHMDSIIQLDKRYQVTAQLGVETDTHDFTGSVTRQEDVSLLTQDALQGAINMLVPSYIQTPPIFSALKYQGLPLYKHARREKKQQEELSLIVTSKARRVFLYEVALQDYSNPLLSLEIHVSHGTYIRSLIHDIAKQVNSCATTRVLKRLAVGPFTLDSAIIVESLATKDAIKDHIIPVDCFLQKLPAQ